MKIEVTSSWLFVKQVMEEKLSNPEIAKKKISRDRR